MESKPKAAKKPFVTGVTNNFELDATAQEAKEQWKQYRTKEKKFAKEFIATLRRLHRLHAKHGHGDWGKYLEGLGICRMTAHRLMNKKPPKDKRPRRKHCAKRPMSAPRVLSVTNRSMMYSTASAYLTKFESEKLLEEIDAFIAKLNQWRMKELAITEKKKQAPPLVAELAA
jgi:hypothetical protein